MLMALHLFPFVTPQYNLKWNLLEWNIKLSKYSVVWKIKETIQSVLFNTLNKIKCNGVNNHLFHVFSIGFSFSSGVHLINKKLGVRCTYYFFINRLNLIYNVFQVWVYKYSIIILHLIPNFSCIRCNTTW